MPRLFVRERLLIGTAAWLLIAAQGIAVAQQGMPNTQEMVEALKPRTRSVRNLVVGEVAASAPAGASTASTVGAVAPVTATEPAAAEPVAPRPSLSMAIHFDFDSAKLRPEGAAVLDLLAAALRTSELKNSHFLIEGHTDAKGVAEYNLRLSQQRADEVRRYLQAHGAAEQRLSAVGRGAQEPANPAQPLAAENRRVRIINVD